MNITKANINVSTCFSFCTFKASVNELVSKFGEPDFVDRDEDEKCQYEWNLRVINGNKVSVFTVYDWKEYRLFERDEIIEWHIGRVADKNASQHTNMFDVEVALKEVGFNPSMY